MKLQINARTVLWKRRQWCPYKSLPLYSTFNDVTSSVEAELLNALMINHQIMVRGSVRFAVHRFVTGRSWTKSFPPQIPSPAFMNYYCEPQVSLNVPPTLILLGLPIILSIWIRRWTETEHASHPQISYTVIRVFTSFTVTDTMLDNIFFYVTFRKKGFTQCLCVCSWISIRVIRFKMPHAKRLLKSPCNWELVILWHLELKTFMR
jgi:hypothetical protein